VQGRWDGVDGKWLPKMQYARRQGLRALRASTGSVSVWARNPAEGVCASDQDTRAMPPHLFPFESMLTGGIFSSRTSQARKIPMSRPCWARALARVCRFWLPSEASSVSVTVRPPCQIEFGLLGIRGSRMRLGRWISERGRSQWGSRSRESSRDDCDDE